MAGSRPRQGWVYFFNPSKIYQRCNLGHHYLYDNPPDDEFTCQHPGCTVRINSSRVFRGYHPHIIWTSDQFQQATGEKVQLFAVIPLTSSEREKGLITTYPINPTQKNGLTAQSFTLIHQIFHVDANCLKDQQGNWLERVGQIDKKDKENIQKRLKYYFGITNESDQDWFRRNATPELLQKVFFSLSPEQRTDALDSLLDALDD